MSYSVLYRASRRSDGWLLLGLLHFDARPTYEGLASALDSALGAGRYTLHSLRLEINARASAAHPASGESSGRGTER